MGNATSPLATKCPGCQALFRVTRRQLTKAQGRVRCSRCGETFDARRTLRVEKQPAAPAAKQGAVAADSVTSEPQSPRPKARPTALPSTFHEWDITRGTFEIPEQTLAPPGAPAFLTRPRASVELDPKPGPSQEGVVERKPAAEKPVQDSDNTPDAPMSTPEPTPTAEHRDDINVDGDDWKLMPQDRHVSTQSGSIVVDESSWAHEEMGDEARGISVGQHVPPPGEEAAEDYAASLERGLTSGLHRHGGRRKRSVASSVAFLVLLLVLMTQLGYFFRDSLSRYPQLRTVITALCQVAQCRVQPRRELAKINLVDRDVRRHPLRAEALLITLALLNSAPFPQPFPLLELSFSDQTGRTVATRRFAPREYLPQAESDAPLMVAGDVMPVTLEISDPGAHATSYRFEFYRF